MSALSAIELEAETVGSNSAEVSVRDFEVPNKPIPLVQNNADPKPYPIDALGPVMAPMARYIAEYIQADEALAAVAVLGVASLTAQQFANIQPPYASKPKPCTLYLVAKVESGERKTAVFDTALAPIYEWQDVQTDIYEFQLEDFKLKQGIYERKKKKAEDKAKTIDEAIQAIEQLGPAPVRPLSPIVRLDEPTTEALLATGVNSHPSRAIFTDEAGNYLGGHAMSSEKKIQTFTVLSKLWDGGSIALSRIGRETPTVKNQRLTVCLAGQGVVIDPLLSDPVASGQGFLARFLVSEAKPKAGSRKLRLLNDDTADTSPALEWKRQILNIWNCRRLTLKQGTRNELDPVVLNLSEGALVIWSEYEQYVELEQGAHGKYSEVKAYASKSAEQALRLAGVMTVVEQPEDERSVTEEVMARAISLSRFYLDEFVRLSEQCQADPHLTMCQKLIDFVRCKRGNVIYKADLQQSSPIRNREQLSACLATLVEYQHLLPVANQVVDRKNRHNCYEVVT